MQQAIQLVFRKMTELGSVRQVLVWFLQESIALPSFPHDSVERRMIWKLPGYASLHSMLTNLIYAGAYVYGRRETRTKIVDDRIRKSAGHRKPQSEWKVLIKDHHPSWPVNSLFIPKLTRETLKTAGSLGVIQIHERKTTHKKDLALKGTRQVSDTELDRNSS